VVLEYAIPSPADAAIDVYDAGGQCVRRLTAGPMSRGMHMASFDTRGIPAGEYSCSLQMAGDAWSVPIQLVRSSS
jgi:hypothetical protein